MCIDLEVTECSTRNAFARYIGKLFLCKARCILYSLLHVALPKPEASQTGKTNLFNVQYTSLSA